MLAVAWLSLPAGSARAEPPSRSSARLAWARGVGAESCVGRIALEEDVKARLGYDPFVLPEPLTIEGAIFGADVGFRAEFVVRDARGKLSGSRRLASPQPDCRPLGEAIAVAITLAIEPDASGARAPLAEERPPDTVVEAPPPRAPAPPEPQGHASLGAGVALGILPDLTPSGSLRVRRWLTRSFTLGLGAHVWPESRRDGLGFALSTGSVELCVAPLTYARALRWCAGGHAGALHAFVHAEDLAPVDVGTSFWAAAETGPHVSFPLAGPFTIDGSLVAIVPIPRREAFVRGRSSPVWEQLPVGAALDLGLGASF